MIDDKDIPQAKGLEIPTGKEMEDKLKEKAKAEADRLKQYPTIKSELNMYGIEETKDAVIAVCALGNAIASSLEDDGKVTLGDLPKFINPVVKLPAAISGIGEVPKELADLTDEEKEELVALVEGELEVGEKAEEVTTRILNIVYEIKSLVDFVK